MVLYKLFKSIFYIVPHILGRIEMHLIKSLLCPILVVLPLVGCQHQQTVLSYPTEATLVANAYQNGLSQEISIDYKQAYFQLKQAYQRCVAFTTEKEMIFTDNRFEPDLEMGTLFARTGEGQYIYKMLVEGLRNGNTRLTLFLPKEHQAAKARFEKDITWALAQDPQCNHSVINLNKPH